MIARFTFLAICFFYMQAHAQMIPYVRYTSKDGLVADRITDRLRQLLTMARNHSLRPDRQPPQLHRTIRMKQHPDRKPRRAEAVKGSDYDDDDADDYFECKRIDIHFAEGVSTG